jgi:hypothetical protein
MAKETDDEIFIGADYQRHYHIKDEDETTSINITGWALSWMLKKRLAHDDSEALITKTTGGGTVTIAGTFNATPANNLQRATISILDTETDPLAKGDYQWELKRTDAGSETVLAYGKMTLLRGVHRT